MHQCQYWQLNFAIQLQTLQDNLLQIKKLFNNQQMTKIITRTQLSTFYQEFGQFSLQKLEHIIHSNLFLFPQLTLHDLINSQSILIFFHQQTKIFQSQTSIEKSLISKFNSERYTKCKQICQKIINGTFQYTKNVQKQSQLLTKQKQKDINQEQNIEGQLAKQIYYQKELFSKEILHLIFKIQPKCHQLINCEIIQKMQTNNIAAILDLLQVQLQNELVPLDESELIRIFQNILVTICVSFPQFNLKSINLIKKCKNYQSRNDEQNKNVKAQMSKGIASSYLQFCKNNQISSCPTEIQLKNILSYLMMIESIHCQGQGLYPPCLIKRQYFLKDIERLLLCSCIDPELSTSNSIAINIYGALLKQLNLYHKKAQVFINLYSTLSSFGTHLIKDVWQSFYTLTKSDTLQAKQDILFSQERLIDILFYKIQNHDNAHVVKLCLQSILKSAQSYELFNCVPDAVYNSLMRMLNMGVHYMDCVFHMDSKMYPMIYNFFCNFYNHHCPQSQLREHLKKFLKSINEKLTFDHAIVAAINCFSKITKKTKMVGKQQLKIISCFINKCYKRFPTRKRNQLMKGLTFLIKNHLNPTINQDIEQQNSQKITLQHLFKNCLNSIPNIYLNMSYGTYEMKKDIQKIVKKNYSKTTINTYIKNSLNKVLQKNCNLNGIHQEQLLGAVQKIMFILQIDEIQKQTLAVLKNVYQKLYDFLIDFGESLYKNAKDRISCVIICNQLLTYKTQEKLDVKFLLQSQHQRYDCLNFVKSVLNNLSLLTNSLLKQTQGQKQYLKPHEQDLLELVHNMFEVIYFRKQSEQSLKFQTIAAQFLQWAKDNIRSQLCVKMIITILKVRITSSSYKKIQTIQQSIYQIHGLVLAQELNNFKSKGSQLQAQQVKISPILRLRLCVLTSNILFSDSTYIKPHLETLLDSIEDFSDRYDYQHYDEMFNFMQNLFTTQVPKNSQLYKIFYNTENDYIQRISKCLQSLFVSTFNNLGYGIQTKQAISSSQCIVKVLFSFAVKYGVFNQKLVKACQMILKTGQQYWMFQRTFTYALITQIKRISHSTECSNIDWTNIYPLVLQIICIEQYRGYDSAIVLQKYFKQNYTFYSQLKFILCPQADYEGVVCRFQFLSFINKIQKKQNKFYQTFLVQFFKYLVPIVTTQNKEKMFLTGTHKTKLKVWQCLFSFQIEWIFSYRLYSKLNNSGMSINIEEVLLDMLTAVTHNNLSEVRYYEELFLMRLMINFHTVEIVTLKILIFLQDKLIQSICQVNKNISFLVISGIILGQLLNTCKISQSSELYSPAKHLFNSLLSFCCSHVAYFRGLSQFFCLQRNHFETDYTKILLLNYKHDDCSIALQQKLQDLINEYTYQILNWQIYQDLLSKQPTRNGNFVSQDYYIQKMKRLGQYLVKEIKHEDGFQPYKDVWKTSMKVINSVNGLNNQNNLQEEESHDQTQIFQRKIDPSLDFIYFSKSKLVGHNMKILVTGSKSIPLYGHLSRTGQIFGLSQLIVPDKSIIELDSYKTVSCTAEKWLNITQFCTKKDIENPEMYQRHLQNKIIELKKQNFQIIKIDKIDPRDTQSKIASSHKLDELKRNLVLVVDSQNIFPKKQLSLIDYSICFEPYFSQHVQASILVWEYLKKVIGDGFK